MFAADAGDFAVGQDEFEAGDMVGGDAVGESVWPTGVFRDVAADGARFLAGGIRSEVEAVGFGGEGEFGIDNTGLYNRALIFGVEFKDAIHARENDHYAAGPRQRAAGETGTGTAADDGDVVFRGEFDDLGDLSSGSGKDYAIGAAFFERAVVFVEKKVFGPIQNGGGAEKLFEVAKKARLHRQRDWRRTWHYSEIAGTGAT